VIELEKKMGSSFFFLAQQFAANCKKSRMYYCQQQKTKKKSVDLGFSKVGLLSFSLTSLNKAKSALCFTAYPPPKAEQQLLDVVFLLSTDSFTAVEFYQVFVLKSCNRV
jgi:hypothetical protein